MAKPAAPLAEVPEATRPLVHEWMKLAKAASDAVEAERKARTELFAAIFPNPKEGTQRAALPAGWQIEADLKFNRPLDEAALPTVLEGLRKLDLSKLMVSIDAMFKYKPSIVISELRKIEAAAAAEARANADNPEAVNGMGQDAMELLAMVMTTKPGLPSIKVVPPKAD